MLKHYR